MVILVIFALVMFLSNPEYWKLIQFGAMALTYIFLASAPILGVLGLLVWRLNLI